jgi:NADPH:quinone reductase-like Zn-dependent oxidoreductase
MRAIVCHRPSSPAELRVEELDRPATPADGLLVRVRASSANPVDLFQLSPVAHLQRGFKPARVGTDFAGVVEAVGGGVTGFKVGDEVFGAARGAFAEYVSVAQSAGVVRKPAGVAFEDAGTLAVAGSTALQSLTDHGHLERGQRVLVNGASGGVGTFAVQIAKALGAEVTAVCSPRNVDLVRSLGASRVIDYTDEDFTKMGERYDLLVDVAGNRSWSECRSVLVSGGSYVGVGAAAIQHGRGGSLRALGHFASVALVSARSGYRVRTLFIAKLRKDDLAVLGELVAQGRVRPVIERSYPLAAAGEALDRINQGHLRGKLAIRIAG